MLRKVLYITSENAPENVGPALILGSEDGSWSLPGSNPAPVNFHTMRINRAIGLGLTLVILKFLMQDSFTAGEGALEALFGAAETSFSHIENTASATEINARALIPR